MASKHCFYPSLFLLAFLSISVVSEEKMNLSIQDQLALWVEQAQKESGLVGLGAAVSINGADVVVGVSGKKRKGASESIAVDDRWHIGSVTKSITATLVARLVEQERMSWNTSLRDVFPSNANIHKDWQSVTVKQLLQHSAGAPANFSFLTTFSRPSEGEERKLARRSLILKAVEKAPITKPGASFRYSNVGYTIVGVICEEITGESWEELVRKEVFRPLNLSSGGFGPPKSTDSRRQPRGHKSFLSYAIAVKEDDDNSPILGPAGTVHMSLRDLVKYGILHLQSETPSPAVGKGIYLTEESLRELHAPGLDDYALGWVVQEDKEWINGDILWHNGSNLMWYTLLAIIPSENFVVAITTNEGDLKVADKVSWELVRKIYLASN